MTSTSQESNPGTLLWGNSANHLITIMPTSCLLVFKEYLYRNLAKGYQRACRLKTIQFVLCWTVNANWQTFWKETLQHMLIKWVFCLFFFPPFQLNKSVCLLCLWLAAGQKEVVKEGKRSLECRLKSPNRSCPVPVQPILLTWHVSQYSLEDIGSA